LQHWSPCVHAGRTDSVPAAISTDLGGKDRVWGTAVDMGAYEYILEVNLGHDTVLCLGSPLTISGGNTGSEFIWSTGDTSQTITVVQSGTYYVMVTNTTGTVSDTIVVATMPYPVVNLGNDTVIALNSSLVLDAGNPGCSYLWRSGETTQTIPAFPYSSVYWVTVTNSAGCFDRDTIIVDVTVGIDEPSASAPQFSLVPNPAANDLYVVLVHPDAVKETAVISDALGRELRRFDVVKSSTRVSLLGLPAGVYFVKVGAMGVLRFVKE
ncbi:MAG: T9SS type A sorting domain-containing protein, partial [Sphingobacteriales bacterium]